VEEAVARSAAAAGRGGMLVDGSARADSGAGEVEEDAGGRPRCMTRAIIARAVRPTHLREARAAGYSFVVAHIHILVQR
jgi:hypothetical protein